MKLIETASYEKLSRSAANLISAQVILKPDSVLGLATGSSPLGTYRQLITWYEKGDVDFDKVISVNLDEYVGLSTKDAQSYRHFMNENFFNHINIRPENTFVPDGCAKNLDAACKAYDAHIEAVGGIDLQLLGIGHNGHIGFNEPTDNFPATVHTVQLTESTINANSRLIERREDVPTQAITMGIGTIMKAKKILLIAGPDKAEIVEKACFGKVTPEVPASVLQLHPDVTVILSAEK